MFKLNNTLIVYETLSWFFKGLHRGMNMFFKKTELAAFCLCRLLLFILSGETDVAKALLTHCLDQDSTFSDAHLLMAQVN